MGDFAVQVEGDGSIEAVARFAGHCVGYFLQYLDALKTEINLFLNIFIFISFYLLALGPKNKICTLALNVTDTY